MVPYVEAYAAQDSTQYRSSDFRISADSPPGVGLSIRSPALVLYSAPPTREGSWPSWPNCSEYRYLRHRSSRLSSHRHWHHYGRERLPAWTHYLRPSYMRGVSTFPISRIHINSTFEENFELVAVRVRWPAPCKSTLAQLGTACKTLQVRIGNRAAFARL